MDFIELEEVDTFENGYVEFMEEVAVELQHEVEQMGRELRDERAENARLRAMLRHPSSGDVVREQEEALF